MIEGKLERVLSMAQGIFTLCQKDHIMNRNNLDCISLGAFRILIISMLFMACCFIYGHTVHAIISTDSSNFMQFKAQGHILGFIPKGMHVASSDHILGIEFAGTDGVKPIADGMSPTDGRVQPLERVNYPDLWTGINLSYEAVSGGIVQSIYQLEPGADVSRIRLRYNAPVKIEAGGNLRIDYENGWMNESAPIAWQVIDGERIPVTVAYTLYDSAEKTTMIGYSLGEYNPAHQLIIDPTLNWKTFMGSEEEDEGAYAIAVDGDGNVYVAGYSDTTWGSPVNAYTGSRDAFAAKLNSSGELQWNTFMGSADFDGAAAIAVDSSGNVYVSGSSPATWGSPVNSFTGGGDAFVAKLSNSGVLQWNTFLGSVEEYEGAYAIAVDGSGNVYVAGNCKDTWGLPVNAFTGGGEAFVAKLNTSGVLQWNTFMGSTSADSASGIAMDDNGNLYVAGSSDASWGAPVNPYAGSYHSDAFVAKLNSGGVLQWNTFMGSAFTDQAHAIAVDSGGNVYVGGHSYNSWGLPVNAFAGDKDAFAVKLSSDGELQWNTFLGSVDDYDTALGITVSGSGNVYVSGSSFVTWGSPVNAFAGGVDAYIAKLSNSGELLCNTFMGAGSVDVAYAIAADGSENVYVAGHSYIWDSDREIYWDLDAFAAKFPTSFLAQIGPDRVNAMPWIQLLLLDDVEVIFPDSNLEAAIRAKIGKPTGRITTTDLEGMTELNASDLGIQSIEGLQFCKNLKNLYLGRNQISDISPLSGLIKLTFLNLWDNQLSDINPLAGLTNLTYLNLWSNQLNDISSLAGLTNLDTLYLNENQISNISPLSGLTNLTELWIQSNQISNLNPLSSLFSVTELFLNYNQISDLSPLSGLANLTYLSLDGNDIVNISPLSGLTNLTVLELSDNQIINISSISGLTKLVELYFYNDDIIDISSLSGLTNLTILHLSWNHIIDISPLSGLTKLTSLLVSGNQISDISAIVNNTGIGSGDVINLTSNPLNVTSCDNLIPELVSRGTIVSHDCSGS